MRIVVNDIAASEGGALSILQDFYEAVKKYDTENEYVFLLSAPYLEETDNIKILLLPKIKKNPFNKLLFDFLTGRKLMKSLDPDVVFSLQNIITFGVKAPQIVYVHQSLPYQETKRFSFRKAEERKFALKQHIVGRMIHRSVKEASGVIVQTNWMKQAIIKKTRKAKERIYVMAPTMKEEVAIEASSYDCHRFFYPTSDFVYKNNELLVDASRILVKDGVVDFSVEMTLEAKKKDVENIYYTGRLSRREVMKKYKEGTLVFPSYIETFGMPLAEARNMGTMILASRCGYALEVLEGYENAYFFDYDKPEQLAQLMKKVILGEISLKEVEKCTQSEDTWKSVIGLLIENGHLGRGKKYDKMVKSR